MGGGHVCHADSLQLDVGFPMKEGNISNKEMYRTFNMGYGFVIICPKSQYVDVNSILSDYKIKNTIIGNIVSHRGVKINGKSII